MLCQSISISRIYRIFFVDGEVLESERLVGVGKPDGVDGGSVADFLNAKFAASAKPIER